MPIIDLSSVEDLSGDTPLWEVSIEGYRYVLYSGNLVRVYKGDSSVPAYKIDHSGCSCPAAGYGNTKCKHRVPFTWVGDGAPRAGTANNTTRHNANGSEKEDQDITNLF